MYIKFLALQEHSPPWSFSAQNVTRKLSIYLFCKVIRTSACKAAALQALKIKSRERKIHMKVKIMQRNQGERGGIACLPLVRNIPKPRSNNWKKVICPVCGEECWESELAHKIISTGTKAACTMCALSR